MIGVYSGMEKISLHERITRLRTAAQRQGLRIRDSEIKAIFAAARKELRGERDGFDQGQWLDIPDESWIWEPILSRGGINLVTAHLTCHVSVYLYRAVS